MSQRLKRYYKRVGGKVVFKNGLTLNKLAFEMWEKLDCREIDPSVISKVINGKRTFTKRQLTIFCRIVGLGKEELKELETDLARDILGRFGFSNGDIDYGENL